ncbi:T-box-containing protein TBX6L-like [Chiloscyllium plagiosum]|uniref:T-box-containing protein TBX6L-like n=1 Tax=Chiloscyllium plagiosum TaxID=36176 RepID=UPI001CB87A19|nr:T-box-containing protein TBX6L-like [Chiloscyllium plagiosum]
MFTDMLKLEPSRCVRGTADQTDPWSSVRVTLQDQALWQTFHAVGTEMIINKSGRRMFPQCNINVSGLMPFSRYTVMVDLVPADGMRYKWYKDQWAVCGKSEPQPPCVTYIHPDSPALGTHWMKKTIHFRKLKLTNNMLDQSGHIILHSMHRYQPRFHIVQEESPLALRWSLVQSFTFPETVFVAVTAYQNEKITKLKIDHNPFAKGFRDMEMKNKSSSAHQLHPRMEVRNRPSSEGHRAHLDVSAVPMMELSPDVVLGSQQTQDYPGPFNMALNSGSTIRAISHVHGQTAGPLSQWGVPRQDRNELHPNGQSSHLGMEFGCHRVPSYPATSGVMEWNPYPVFPYPCW